MGSKTWTECRREISRRVKEPFNRQFGNYGVVDGVLGATAFWDDALAKFTTNPGWKFSTAYFPSGNAGGQELEISNFLVPPSVSAGYAYVSPVPQPTDVISNDLVWIDTSGAMVVTTGTLGKHIRFSGQAETTHGVLTSPKFSCAPGATIRVSGTFGVLSLTPTSPEPSVNLNVIFYGIDGTQIDISSGSDVFLGNVAGVYTLLSLTSSAAPAGTVSCAIRVGYNPTGAPCSIGSDDLSAFLSATIAAGDYYEFHSRFRVSEKVDAVNAALRDAYPAFYRFTTDTSIIIQKWKRVYDLTAISPRIKNISRIYIEPMWLFASGKATGGSASTMMDSNQTFALDTTKTYEVAIYYGTGAGQVRNINVAASANTSTLTLDDDNWTTTPDTTSEYVVKNTLDVDKPWIGPQTRIRLDTADNPSALETLDGLTGYWGARIKIEYFSLVAEISGESSTIEDQAWGYILPRALYHLFIGNIGFGPQKEVDTSKVLAAQYEAEAEQARARNRYPPLTSTVHTEQRFQIGIDRERPFNTGY